MKKSINDFVINVATVNGSGSQSANTILLKSLFRMGIPVGGKNVFPSNIAGLPTWFWIRANSEGFVARRKQADIVIGMNPQTLASDCQSLKPGGVLIYNSDIPLTNTTSINSVQTIAIPFKKIVDQATETVKIKKLLINTIYVGVLTELLHLDLETVIDTLKDQFKGKQSVVDTNLRALHLGIQYAKENLGQVQFPFAAEKMKGNDNKMIIDGNTATALGLMFGGCSFVSWYPITPSSSVIENFSRYCEKYRTASDGTKNFAIIQAEDELASICMVLGAGWAGTRAMTATSGPGLSLMSEAAGYSYYAEIPAVIWNVQRVGPSTGMPTRTAQGDLLTALYLSHGDTKHPLLIPGTAKECFEFGQLCFDLAERLQQLVIVLSDLELGMNLWMEDQIVYPTKTMDRGKRLGENDFENRNPYFRYEDLDGDGIAPRSIPGTRHKNAPYFTRGSGHNAKGNYTEDGTEYKELVDRLAKKWQTAKELVPRPIQHGQGAQVGIIAYGSTDGPMDEARCLLQDSKIATDYLRIRALPFTSEVEQFLNTHEHIYVIEQNRDAQLLSVLLCEYPFAHNKLKSILHYDGTPITADFIFENLSTSQFGITTS